MRAWDDVIPDEDGEIYELAGFGKSVGFGSSPAVLVIDVQYRTTGDRPAPIRDSIAEHYPTSCGQYGWDAVEEIARVLETARARDVPVIYPCVAPKTAVDMGRFGQINPAVLGIREKGYEFVSAIAPQEGDVVIPKRHASAFFGTALMSYLVDFGVDTVIVTGATTSGCVRATVADAFSYNLRTIVAEEAVFDRIQISHKVSLYDMDAKYADVLSVDEVIARLEALD
jgi:maleamate amidohydrolase